MTSDARIELAHAAGFTFGRVTVKPATRELVRDDGVSEVLEPRVMQVLVALARAEGAIVTRDELSRWCWEGRVVGEDAINRVISRLRRSAEGIGEGSFAIETVTKVGYRLVHTEAARSAEPSGFPARTTGPGFDRRAVIAGGAAVAVAGATALLWPHRRTAAAVPPEVEALMTQAAAATGQATSEGQNQAIALYQRVVTMMPNYADAWGQLGNTYAQTARNRPSVEAVQFRARAKEAAARALAIDPGNAYALAARAYALPRQGNWLEIERGLRPAIAEHPDNAALLFALASILASVGRWSDTLATFERAMRLVPVSPQLMYLRIVTLWSANRLVETDRAMADAAALYPTHFAVWFSRFYVLLYTGRANQALAMVADSDTRPSGIPVEEFDSIGAVARAIATRDPTLVPGVARTQMDWAHRGAGYAENATQFLCALGRIDDAFAIANALYFDRGFAVPERRFSKEQQSFSPKSDRTTSFLFNPSMAPMWRDPRFGVLMRDLKLERYWQESGSRPDYRK